MSLLLVPNFVVMTGQCFQVTINHFYHSEVCVFCQVGQVQTVQLRREGFTIIREMNIECGQMYNDHLWLNWSFIVSRVF